ncbi:hypothetical protein NDU88_004406 [Pleurodeles waltl]|uniref:Uncharacterized protein n=1 Tax=Pleurodeles waltl TaxID=8319 RepID=A0AAV7VG48_PLEWA|nr:hypothetical protein NDU88_004406 [Pleurodeles waltl]
MKPNTGAVTRAVTRTRRPLLREARHTEDQLSQKVTAGCAIGRLDTPEAAYPAELQHHIRTGWKTGPRTVETGPPQKVTRKAAMTAVTR